MVMVADGDGHAHCVRPGHCMHGCVFGDMDLNRRHEEASHTARACALHASQRRSACACASATYIAEVRTTRAHPAPTPDPHERRTWGTTRGTGFRTHPYPTCTPPVPHSRKFAGGRTPPVPQPYPTCTPTVPQLGFSIEPDRAGFLILYSKIKPVRSS